MRFKDWIVQETRFKGLKRQFVASHPGMPRYVANDIYNNRIGYSFGKMLGQNGGFSPTIGMEEPEPNQENIPTHGIDDRATTASSMSPTPSQIFNIHNLGTLNWSPRPITINVSPMDFDEETLQAFMNRRFGFDPSKKIRNDAERMNKQLSLLASKESNEPVIIVKQGNKYKLLEGWHRVMNYLVYPPDPSIGAPPDQIEILKNGFLNQINLTKWKPVTIQAFIGEPRS